jgi:hypothetical protein
MDILPGLKTCRKGLHQYSFHLKQCPECKKESDRRWAKRNPEKERERSQRWARQNTEQAKENSRRWYEQNRERQKENQRRWYKQNAERHNENSRHWKEQNRERCKQYQRSYRDKNPELTKERERRWRAQNPEKVKDKNKRWAKENPNKANAKAAKRRAAKKQAIPPWADLDAIKQIYAEATELSKLTKIQHEVDHIYPLQSDYMCGLHVETNLQILTQTENSSKGNRNWPGQLDCQRLPIHVHGFDVTA